MTAGAMKKVREWRSNHSPSFRHETIHPGNPPDGFSRVLWPLAGPVTSCRAPGPELDLFVAAEILGHFFQPASMFWSASSTVISPAS